MLFIRHGDKAYANGESDQYQLDPPLLVEALAKIEDATLKYCQLYGPPSRLITSPYLRTQQTATIIRATLAKLGHNVDIYVDSLVGEKVDPKYDGLPDPLRQSTLEYQPILPETFRQFRSRVLYYSCNMDSRVGDNHNVWIITHGLFMLELARSQQIKFRYPPFLGGLYIN